jgi:hypothetical protein
MLTSGHHRPMAAAPFDAMWPFTRAAALAAGWTPWQLRGRDVVRLHRNVYVSRRATRTLALRTRGSLLIAPPGSMASHQTAALLWGGAVPPVSVIHLRIPPGETFRVDGVLAHRGGEAAAVRWHRGLPLTSPEATFCDLAPTLDLVQLVVLGDRLVRRQVTSPARLVACADQWRGRGAGTARRAAALVRAGVDSPPESRLRMLIVLAGLPEPTVNHIIRDPHTGAWLRRFELGYPELRIAVEYEGRHHRGDDDVWAADIDRREDLDRRTWRVVQVISSGLDEHPLRTLQRIDQARADRGARPLRAFSEEWRRYFPGRAVA